MPSVVEVWPQFVKLAPVDRTLTDHGYKHVFGQPWMMSASRCLHA
jgi:hypothetical protein